MHGLPRSKLIHQIYEISWELIVGIKGFKLVAANGIIQVLQSL